MSEVQDKQLLKSISSKLTVLLAETKKAEPETWVKSSVISMVTGWDKYGMKTARENGYVKFVKDAPGKPGFWYLLESVNPIWYTLKKAQ